MSPRSLFNIILKVLGIYFAKEFLSQFTQISFGLLYLGRDYASGIGIWLVFSSLLNIAVYGLIIVFLVLKTNWVIDKFELDKGFDETNFSLNIHRSTVLSIVLLLTGLLVTLNALPLFARTVYLYFQERSKNYSFTPADPTYLIVYGGEILIGVVLIMYQKAIVNFIELQRRKTTTPQSDSSTNQETHPASE